MASQLPEFIARRQIPQFHRFVEGASSERLAVATQRNRVDPLKMSSEITGLLSSPRIPNPDNPVQSTRDHRTSIGAEDNSADPTLMSSKRCNLPWLIGRIQ